MENEIDLSHPEGSSINDAIYKDQCSLSCLKLDHVAEIVLELGQICQA